MHELTVEEDRKLPLAMTKDIADGTVKWRGLGVINPFADDGKLVDLARYPLLKRYLESRREQIAGRHCAQKVPANWYRTIDQITPSIAETPKLLIPDIKGQAHIVFEEGRLYPHHNLYYITASQWDLKALQTETNPWRLIWRTMKQKHGMLSWRSGAIERRRGRSITD